MSLSILNPATGEVIRQVPTDSESSIRSKFEKARIAQLQWAKVPLEKKLQIIRNFRELLVSNKDSLADTLTLEVGKPITQSKNELQGVLGRIDFFLETTPAMLKDSMVFQTSGLEERISHEPLGVIANVSAWNYPYLVGANVWIPALLTGNAVLYKPSEFATLTGLRIEQLLHEAGVPQDVFASVIGTGTIGEELLKLPIQGVFFTGSYGTGKKILETMGPRMIRVQLELGGKDPVYVREDADPLAVAAATADGAFYNAGQSCCSVERIYVQEKIYSEFVEAFVQTVQSFVVGDPIDPQTYLGPITREANLSFLENQVADARKKGAKLLLGGQRMKRPGFYFEPTVLSDVNHSMDLMREETFGPLIGIQKVQSDEEAIQLMNDTPYGLTSSVYTQDKSQMKTILSQMNSGSVYWNCCDRVSPNLPWSGRGHSGIGTTLSTYGIESFLQLKAWHLKS
ncbi:MAG: aldehyde dehydrogenase family protein [Bdellovibrionia bacterium]